MYNKYKILHIILLCFIFCGCCRIIPDKLSDSSRYDIIGEVINERMVLLSDSLRYERNEYVVFDNKKNDTCILIEVNIMDSYNSLGYMSKVYKYKPQK